MTWALKWQHTAEVRADITATTNTWSHQRRKRRNKVSQAHRISSATGKERDSNISEKKKVSGVKTAGLENSSVEVIQGVNLGNEDRENSTIEVEHVQGGFQDI